jgi:hypothetical protein
MRERKNKMKLTRLSRIPPTWNILPGYARGLNVLGCKAAEKNNGNYRRHGKVKL